MIALAAEKKNIEIFIKKSPIYKICSEVNSMILLQTIMCFPML